MGALRCEQVLFRKSTPPRGCKTRRYLRRSLLFESYCLLFPCFTRGEAERENTSASIAAAKRTPKKKERAAASAAWAGSSGGWRARVTTPRRSGGRWRASWSRRS